jgi:hypothetical protein
MSGEKSVWPLFTPHCIVGNPCVPGDQAGAIFGQKKFKSKNFKSPVNLSKLRALT